MEPDVKYDIPRVPKDLVSTASEYSAATIYEAAGQIGALPHYIKPIRPNMKLCGTVVTVASRPGDNIIVHKSIYVAQRGDVLLIATSSFLEAAIWGEITTRAAMQRGIAGLVTDGSVRDTDNIGSLGFPTFSQGISIKGTTKSCLGKINYPLYFGDVKVEPGDLILGDIDGVVIITRETVADVIEKARQREEKEKRIIDGINNGKSTLDIYAFADILKREGLKE